MQNKKVDIDVRLFTLNLRREDFAGLTPKEQEKVLKKAYHKKAKTTHPDTKNGSNEAFELIDQAKEILLKHIKEVYFLEDKKVVKDDTETHFSDDDLIFAKMANDYSAKAAKKELERLLDEYAKEEEEKKKRVSQMAERFNKPGFSIKDAINYCKNILNNIKIKISNFIHNEER